MVILFLAAQYIGLLVVEQYVDQTVVQKGNETFVVNTYKELPYEIERPPFEEETSYLPIFLIILGATVVALILVKLGALRLWKLWFFLSIWFCLMIAFAAFLPQLVALALALGITFLKVFWRNTIVHNASELFIYSGLAAVFFPLFNVISISILLALISIYDMIAVWKTAHMVSLAKFQAQSKVFAGLLLQYKHGKEEKTAILGGGDIGFPLLFAAALLKAFGLIAYILPIFSAGALAWLLWMSEKDKYYPAMPFLTLGCMIGLIVVLLV